MNRVAILGSGQVGETLAGGFLKYGYDVIRGSRDPAKLDDWAAVAGPRASTGTFAEAATRGEMVVLAVRVRRRRGGRAGRARRTSRARS